ncbi:MAG: dTDP-4-dehydrorhamnose 3,5-epimerase [Actinomycetota bacterium]|jgi:dTDP-4-dehydrorhamnose 3,5-epimerase|nr:dTDP-4-dehydrorhamnose 3,5-epimerase [Actinomycetota bacterium]MDQ1497956.1 dTDP-4-dehydrorhamnose 3,5-epimerase [Actinomycetota bacterium]MDQ1504812.1 dTDP-4-dehydrorhamnose 3,5-epimerase [Actinomycetota bacterium]
MPVIEKSDTILGVVVVTPDVHGDNRGRFVETFRKEWVPGAAEMVQANRADRKAGALVGLHYHLHQADYWYVPFGRAMVVLHDLRASSPTDEATLVLEIGEHDHRSVYIPPGVAHGFYAMTDMTITYLVDHYYNPDDELGVAWDDPALGVTWPTTTPELSGRDGSNPKRAEIAPNLRPA